MNSGQWVDLASRALGGSVPAANDESFGEKENLISVTEVDFTPGRFGHKGELVDGWETRRRRTPGHDWAIIRLGAPGVIGEIDIDTTSFSGNYPATVWVEGCAVGGYPSVPELIGPSTLWQPLVAAQPVLGDAHNVVAVTSRERFTHVRLSIEPDGGVGRLRVRGRVLADPSRFEGLTVNLAAAELGAVVEESSDAFYSSPSVLLLPSTARTMGEGWETRRRRDQGNDWVIVRLAGQGVLRQAEIDTSYFVCNASGEAALWGRCDTSSVNAPWQVLLERTRLQPDTRHFFALQPIGPVSQVRLDVFPDGGVSRLRLNGTLADG